jgi:hypothetical protein
MPAGARGPEHGVVVDADDGANPHALAPPLLGEGAIEVGFGDALLDQYGVRLRAAGAVQGVASRPRCEDHQTRPAESSLRGVLELGPVIR